MATAWPEPPDYYDAPSKGYKVMLQQPGFPVIYQEPSVTQVGESHRGGLRFVRRWWTRLGSPVVLSERPLCSVQYAARVLGLRRGNGWARLRARILERRAAQAFEHGVRATMQLVHACVLAGSAIHWQKPASIFGSLFMGQFGMMHMMQDSACKSNRTHAHAFHEWAIRAHAFIPR